MVIEVEPDEPIGDLIRRARRARFQSQQQLAQQLNKLSSRDTITGHEVGRWENHERIPRPHSRRWLAEALGIDQTVLDRAAAVAAALRRSTAVPAVPGMRKPGDSDCAANAVDVGVVPSAAHTALEEVLAAWDELIIRRALTIGEATHGSAMPRAGGHAAPRLSSDVLETHARLTADYRHLDNLAGPMTVFYHAREHHRHLTSLLAQARDTRQRRRVAGLVTDSGDLMAWLLFDLGEYAQAFACYRQVAEVARQFDDVSTHAYLVGRAARTLSECGRHSAALDVANAAERIAASTAHPAVRSWLAVTRAFDRARLSQEADCRRDLEIGARLLAQTSTADDLVSGYIAFYGTGHLRKWTGHAMLTLANRRPGLARQAAREIDEALGQWPASAVRESAELLIAGAGARLLAREIEQAAMLIGEAHTIARETASRRNMATVNRFRRQAAVYFRHTRGS